MSDPRPYVPHKGARLTYDRRVFMLRQVDGERLLFNVQGTKEAKQPTYRLESRPPHGEYDFNVISLRTGKRMYGTVTVRMARVHRDRPLPKFPLWRGE